MRSFIIYGSIAAIIAFVSFVAGFAVGLKRGAFQEALQENKVAAASLRADDLDLSPGFREYLKGRIYYNIAMTFPNDRGYLARENWDFGRVDMTILSRPIYAKDSTAGIDSYESATSRLTNAER